MRGIDLLRGIAILMVLLLHFGETYRIWDHGPIVSLIGSNWTWSVLGWGNFAVTMFFVVSGFLIATNAAERSGSLGRIDVRSFYIRRFARLLPTLAVALSIILVLGLAHVGSFKAKGEHPTRDLLLGVGSVVAFCHNILMQKLGYFDYALNVYWSLSVEEVFYLAFPFVCVLLRRDLLIAIPCVLFITIAPFYRAAHMHNDIFYLYANLACFDAISIGCLASMIARTWTPSRTMASTMKAVGWLVLAAFWLRGFGGSHKMFSFTVVALSTAAIILGSVDTPRFPRKLLVGRGIRWLGRHSYELYLFHIIVLGLMRDLVPGTSLDALWQMAWLAAYLVLSCAVAAFVATSVGDPINARLRSLLLPTRGPAVMSGNHPGDCG